MQTVRNTVVHPVVLPVLAGFVWNLLGLPLPGPLDAVLQVLGAVALPLCLLATGLALVTYGTQGDWGAAAAIAAAKLLVMPAVVGLAAAFAFGLSGQALAVLVLFAAAPVGANPLIFALRYRCLEGEVSVAIVLSTLAFVLTAPAGCGVAGTIRAMSPNDLSAYMAHVGAAARAAATAMAAASTAAKDEALRRLAALLREHTAALQAANAPDVAADERAGLVPALVDRLRLTPKVLDTVAEGCEQIAAMPDPIGEITHLSGLATPQCNWYIPNYLFRWY